MSETVQPDIGPGLPLADLITTLAYDGDFVETITVSYAGKLYKQTFTNDGTNITSISNWVLQP